MLAAGWQEKILVLYYIYHVLYFYMEFCIILHYMNK